MANTLRLPEKIIRELDPVGRSIPAEDYEVGTVFVWDAFSKQYRYDPNFMLNGPGFVHWIRSSHSAGRDNPGRKWIEVKRGDYLG